MNMALFTYSSPPPLAVPMYKTMGNYGVLNSQWSLILAMVTIAAVLHLGAQAGFGQAALRADEAAHGRRIAVATLPARVPAADGALAGGSQHHALLLAWNGFMLSAAVEVAA
jgi:multiple sugar transport system permease protein